MGCKRGLLSLFAAQCLIDGGLVEVNVWRGKVTAKQILMSVLSSLCGIPVGDFRHAPADYVCADFWVGITPDACLTSKPHLKLCVGKLVNAILMQEYVD